MNKLMLVMALIPGLVLGQNAVDLIKGQPAPFTGILITPDTDLKIKKDLNELDYLRVINDSNKRVIGLLNEQVALSSQISEKWHQEAITQSEARLKIENNQFWKYTGFFTLGAAVTILLTFGVNKASK